MLTALAAYRRSNKPAAFQGTFAFIATPPDEKTALKGLEIGDLLRGVQRRAESLGYGIEYFHISESKEEHQEIGKILIARGIRAAVIRSFPLGIQQLNLPFDKIACVDLFCEPHLEKLNTVTSYHAQSMKLALQEVRKRGYRRPALAVRSKLSEYLCHGWLMAFHIYGASFELPMTYVYPEAITDFTALARWINTNQPDVLLYGGDEIIAKELHQQDSSLARRMGIVALDVHNPNCGVSGIYQNRMGAGTAAVELLQSMVNTGQANRPAPPQSLMIPGTWVDGKTCSFR